MAKNDAYVERLSSTRTTALFIGLTTLFAALFAWQARTNPFGGWGITFLCFAVFFLFYSFNYHTLHLRLDSETLRLRFGLFTWVVPLANIEACRLDRTSLWRIGGAGIHFSFFEGRYRAMFNFLEYPRVVIGLKSRMGPVREIAFSTRQPEQVMQRITAFGTDVAAG